MSSDSGVCIQIFKQKFQNREENIAHIAWQSWYFQMKFSWKKQAALKKKSIVSLFLPCSLFDSNCRNWSTLCGIFWEISHGCWHLQITCESAMVQGQTQGKAWVFESLSLKHYLKVPIQPKWMKFNHILFTLNLLVIQSNY